jgi:hypothetical protein
MQLTTPSETAEKSAADAHLPTPPDEESYPRRHISNSSNVTDLGGMSNLLNFGPAKIHNSNASGSSRGDPPPFDEELGPGFDALSTDRYFEMPDPTSSHDSLSASPSSSGAATGNVSDAEASGVPYSASQPTQWLANLPDFTPSTRTTVEKPPSPVSPWGGKEIPIEESTLNDIE